MTRPILRRDVNSQESFRLDLESVDDSTIPDRRLPRDISGRNLNVATRETFVVRFLRLIMVGILGMATIATSITIFVRLRGNESDDFGNSFYDYANNIDQTVRGNLRYRLEGADSLALEITTHVLLQNETFPFVTVPDIVSRASSAIIHAGSTFFMYSPLVTDDNRQRWETYSVENQGWTDQNQRLQERFDANYQKGFRERRKLPATNDEITPFVYASNDNSTRQPDPGPGPYLPIWQLVPAVEITPRLINFNLLANPVLAGGLSAMLDSGKAVLREAANWDDPNANLLANEQMTNLASSTEENVAYERTKSGPGSNLFYPVYDSFGANRTLAGSLTLFFQWRQFLLNSVPDKASGIICVLENTCGQMFSYRIDGNDAVYLGEGDLHDPSFSSYEFVSQLTVGGWGDRPYSGEPLNTHYCPFTLRIYPSSDLEGQFVSSSPAIYTTIAILLFLFAVVVFIMYDCKVARRQRHLMDAAKKTNSIVASLFPAVVRERLYQTSKDDTTKLGEEPRIEVELPEGFVAGHHRLTASPSQRNIFKRIKAISQRKIEMPPALMNPRETTKPIADLFAQCTVFFADIAGFTAWSSEREPEQVFILLETLYGAFDKLAHRRGVFKIETIGDCYVAITGCPEPQEKHAVIMTRFARDCLSCMQHLSKKLESKLGPDTGDLALRVGLHSGPVTGGVLRGEKARFQLFGDTVNTASRMESNGEKNRIHCSQPTADLLAADGKAHWVTDRDEKIRVKGKGEMQTYWIDTLSDSDGLNGSGNLSLGDSIRSFNSLNSFPEGEDIINEMRRCLSDKELRLVDWNTTILLEALKELMVRREATTRAADLIANVDHLDLSTKQDATPFEELTENLHLQRFDERMELVLQEDVEVEVPAVVETQLKNFIKRVASMYKNIPFHNFEHASHVAQSANKMLKRVAAAEALTDVADFEASASELHDHTFGLTSDPMARFAVLFSSVVHDVDHAGVSNFQLVEEKSDLAMRYKNRSVLEQNSVDVVWELLMKPDFEELRKCIFPTEIEHRRFRQLLVNMVLATDIFDWELAALRRNRWQKAFAAPDFERGRLRRKKGDLSDRKATIVIDHIMQASDVAHTMQHWVVYLKWNRRLFEEMYRAYRLGRMGSDPSIGWYRGELMFFDNYVIPLGRKLKDCGVFGVTSDQLLNSAIQNREQWAAKGEDIVRGMVAELCHESSWEGKRR